MVTASPPQVRRAEPDARLDPLRPRSLRTRRGRRVAVQASRTRGPRRAASQATSRNPAAHARKRAVCRERSAGAFRRDRKRARRRRRTPRRFVAAPPERARLSGPVPKLAASLPGRRHEVPAKLPALVQHPGWARPPGDTPSPRGLPRIAAANAAEGAAGDAAAAAVRRNANTSRGHTRRESKGTSARAAARAPDARPATIRHRHSDPPARALTRPRAGAA